MIIHNKQKIYPIYHENSKLNQLYSAKELDLSKLVSIPKKYPKSKKVCLHLSDGFKKDSFLKILTKRRTNRNFKKKTISFKDFSKICFYSYGCSGKIELDNKKINFCGDISCKTSNIENGIIS